MAALNPRQYSQDITINPPTAQRQRWEHSKETSECWGEGQEQGMSKGLAMGLLLGGEGMIQNGAVGTATLEVRRYGSELRCIKTSWEEGRIVQRF